MLKIYENQQNYTCQVIKLPTKKAISGLDNLVEVTYQGNSVLISKDSPEDEFYLFFPSECQISHDYLSKNNLYRHINLNIDPNVKPGFFEDNRRVKALKFKGIISSGFIMPIGSLSRFVKDTFFYDIKVGDEFNEIDGVEICKKYVRKVNSGKTGFSNPKTPRIENVVDSKMTPEHMDTAHLMKNLHKLDLDTKVSISHKLHGTSARVFHTLVKRKLSWFDKLAKRLGIKVLEEEYDYVVASRRCLKSVGFEELPNKNHFFKDGDLWSEFAKKELHGKLNKGEAIYFEIIGKTYNGEEIQSGYSYDLDKPIGYVYRISNINPQGIEVDLPYDQMKERCSQLGLNYCPELFNGTVEEFLNIHKECIIDNENQITDLGKSLENLFYNKLLEQSSILDPKVIEEGFCIRIDKYPKPEIFKIKSKKFLAHESKANDKGVIDLEEEQVNDSRQTTDKESNSSSI